MPQERCKKQTNNINFLDKTSLLCIECTYIKKTDAESQSKHIKLCLDCASASFSYMYLNNINMPIFKNFALLPHYAASSGNFLPVFWDNLLVPSSGVRNPIENQLSQYWVETGRSVGGENSR